MQAKQEMEAIKNLDNKVKEIIETVTNSNGTAIKFADGTMICTGIGQCPANVGYAEIIFANSFIDINYTMIANHKYTGGSNYGGSTQLRNITNPQSVNNSSAYVYSYQYDGTVANYPRNVQYVAMGRWK